MFSRSKSARILFFLLWGLMVAARPSSKDIRWRSVESVGKHIPEDSELKDDTQREEAKELRKKTSSLKALLEEFFPDGYPNPEEMKRKVAEYPELHEFFVDYIKEFEEEEYFDPEKTDVQKNIIQVVSNITPDVKDPKLRKILLDKRSLPFMFENTSDSLLVQFLEDLIHFERYENRDFRELPTALSQALQNQSEIDYYKRLNKIARGLAIHNHALYDQRYDGKPNYLYHLAMVRDVLNQFGIRLSSLVLGPGAYLHDVEEDTAITRSILSHFLPFTLISLMSAVTNVSKEVEPDKIRRKILTFEKVAQSVRSVVLKLADTNGNIATGSFNELNGTGESKRYKYIDLFPIYEMVLFKEYHPPVVHAMWKRLKKMLFDRTYQVKYYLYQVARAAVLEDHPTTYMTYEDLKNTVHDEFKYQTLDSGLVIAVPR